MKIAMIAATAALCVAFAGSGHAASAPYRTMGPYPWCAKYNNMTGDCGFSTHEQCEEAASGNGGTCALNPGYVDKHPQAPYGAS